MLGRNVTVRVLIAVVAICGLVALAFGNIVRVAAEGHRTYGVIGDFALALASIPKNFKEGMSLVLEGGQKDLAVGTSRFGDDKGFIFNTPNGTGYKGEYLLLSRYDADRERSIVELVDLAANRIIHTWLPDFEAINARS